MADPTAVQPDPLLPTYRWNPRARRGLGAYIDRRGRFVSKAAVRAQLDAVVAGLGDEAAGVTRALRAGEVTLNEWYGQMRGIVKSSHVVGAAMQRGGFYQLTQGDFGRVGSIVRKEYGFLNNYAGELEAGTKRPHAGRSRQYAQQARATYYAFDRDRAAAAQMVEMRSVLHARESCTGSDGCVAQAGLGWIPIDSGDFIPIGGRRCKGNCLCTLEYRNAAGEVEAA